MMETRMGRADESEDVVVAAPRVEERHEVVVNGVADLQPEHSGVEAAQPAGRRSEQERVAEPARIHITGNFAPGRPADPLPASTGVDEDLRDRPGWRLL